MFALFTALCYYMNMVKESMQNNLKAVYEFIKAHASKMGYPPSVREICSELNISSTATVHYYLTKLQEQGLIVKSSQKNRALGIPGAAQNKIKSIPIIGRVHAGNLSLAEQVVDDYYSNTDGFFRGNSLFMLTVKGDSMKNAGINDGDLAVIMRQSTAENGEIVVAMHDNEATIKRYYNRNGKIVLHPENNDYEDIVLSNVEVVGILTGLIRRY